MKQFLFNLNLTGDHVLYFQKEIIAVKWSLKMPTIVKSRHVSMIPFLLCLRLYSLIVSSLSYIIFVFCAWASPQAYTNLSFFSIRPEAYYKPYIVADAHKLSTPEIVEMPWVRGQFKIQSETFVSISFKFSSVCTFTPLMILSIIKLSSFKNRL